MTDEELIAWLRDLAAVLGKEAFTCAADRLEALVKENIALKEHVADMLAEQECGCGYDKPTDVCLGHLPLHRKTVARAERLEAALRTARVHVANNAEGWSVSRGTARNDLTIVDAALKGADHE